MPFIVIKGSYRLCGGSAAKPTGFQPDGDSIEFKPDNPALLDRLERAGRPCRLSSIGSTQLRFDGIDALELHFGGTHQPRPLADEGRDFLTGMLGMNPVAYEPPDYLTVKAPAGRDGRPGFILARSLEAHGRPVSFAYAGEPPAPDGSELDVSPALLRESLNCRSLAAGNSYPLFYDTLVADLRDIFTEAAATARQAGKGLWSSDLTASGTTAESQADLEQRAVVFPKLFRRLASYVASGAHGLDGFLAWLRRDAEPVLDLGSGKLTHFDGVLEVTSGKVRMIRPPETLVFVSAKTADTA
ncbi:MAG: hypothetical protein ACXVZW_01850, partial [Gaiellaceae bacterium]